jgi:hypothetical protein
MLAAAVEPPKEESGNAPAGGQSGGSSQQPGGNSEAPEGDNVSVAAQLKVLRDLQAELLERTLALAKFPADESKWTPAQKRELEKIRREQAELAELLAELGDELGKGKP